MSDMRFTVDTMSETILSRKSTISSHSTDISSAGSRASCTLHLELNGFGRDMELYLGHQKKDEAGDESRDGLELHIAYQNTKE